MSAVRTRWTAIGAAVAVTLGAGGLSFVSATTPDDALTLVPITPCRVADTRPDPHNTGTAAIPVGPGEELVISAHGDNGECTGIPNRAEGLSLNVTTTDATEGTFLTIWPTGATRPNASSLNPQPLAPPIPNAVVTGVSTTGQFSIYNFLGNVNVIVDINGYYIDHHHDERYYTKADVDQIVEDATAPDPWEIKIPATNLSPLPGVSQGEFTQGTGHPINVAGFALAPVNKEVFAANWALPPSYRAGSPIGMTVHWLPENLIGPDPTACNYVLIAPWITVSRPGGIPFETDATWPNKALTTDPYVAAHPLGPPGDYPVQSTKLVIQGSGVLPGDQIVVRFGRDGDDGTDKCDGDLYVQGITIAEEPSTIIVP